MVLGKCPFWLPGFQYNCVFKHVEWCIGAGTVFVVCFFGAGIIFSSSSTFSFWSPFILLAVGFIPFFGFISLLFAYQKKKKKKRYPRCLFLAILAESFVVERHLTILGAVFDSYTLIWASWEWPVEGHVLILELSASKICETMFCGDSHTKSTMLCS